MTPSRPKSGSFSMKGQRSSRYPRWPKRWKGRPEVSRISGTDPDMISVFSFLSPAS